MTKSLAGAMWALLIRMVLTVIVGRQITHALVQYYARIAQELTRLMW
jgi:hypothetical protein